MSRAVMSGLFPSRLGRYEADMECLWLVASLLLGCRETTTVGLSFPCDHHQLALLVCTQLPLGVCCQQWG